jgi:hypothetical protein
MAQGCEGICSKKKSEVELTQKRSAMHKHTCLICDKVIAEGNFDCEFDSDHDFGVCNECMKEALLMRGFLGIPESKD